MNTETHIYFLLDRSGSMASMADDVIGGFNTFLAGQQSDGDDARMTLVQFDTLDPFELLADARPIGSVAKLTKATFEPRGGTPLLDATGRLIVHASVRAVARKEMGKVAESILFVTFTDGEENSSVEHSRADIEKLVGARQAEGWTFAFLGAGLDAYAESASFGYTAGSVQSWMPDAQGARAAFSSLGLATSSMRGRVRRAEAPASAVGFFGGDKPAEEDRKRRGK